VGRGAVNSFPDGLQLHLITSTTIVIISTNITHLTHMLHFPAAGYVWSRALSWSMHAVVVLHRVSSLKNKKSPPLPFLPIFPPHHIRKKAEGKAGRNRRRKKGSDFMDFSGKGGYRNKDKK